MRPRPAPRARRAASSEMKHRPPRPPRPRTTGEARDRQEKRETRQANVHGCRIRNRPKLATAPCAAAGGGTRNGAQRGTPTRHGHAAAPRETGPRPPEGGNLRQEAAGAAVGEGTGGGAGCERRGWRPCPVSDRCWRPVCVCRSRPARHGELHRMQTS